MATEAPSDADLHKRSLLWLTMLADFAGVDPEDTVIDVKADGASVAKATLAEHISVLEKLAGAPAFQLSDFNEVIVHYEDDGEGEAA